MSLLSIFRRPTIEQYAALHDRVIRAETEATLLRDLVEHPPQPRRQREQRKDAHGYKLAREARKNELIQSVGFDPFKARGAIREGRG